MNIKYFTRRGPMCAPVDEDFELHLSPSSKEVVEIQKSSKETNSFTICFWKKGGGIYVRSYLWLNISQEIFVNLQSPKSFGFVHNSTAWNFYCFLMADKDETLAVSFYLNGERKSLLLIEPEESNNENLIVGYLNSSVNDKAVLSSFNIWSGELSSSEVKRLSYGCDSERGDVIHWKDFNHLDHDHEVVETKTCKNVRKERLVLKGTGNFITVKVDQHAPSNAIGFCLKFRYMIYGPGARFFQTSIIKEHEDVSSVVWKDDDNTQFRWKYADIPFLSPGYFQFHSSNKMLDSALRVNRREGIDQEAKHKPVIELSDITKMRSPFSSADSPTGLLYRILLHCTGAVEVSKVSTRLCVEKDGNGREYICMTHEESSKNHQGGIATKKSNEKFTRLYSTDEQGDSFWCFKKYYLSKLNPNQTSFFQKPKE
ncbi:hypothetical protein AC249_AIPGENE23120 [Exaiptasia diaphana]|nr:hypothetical protein AC249_AIPGENE23120 [Exaiptasia diaphana]